MILFMKSVSFTRESERGKVIYIKNYILSYYLVNRLICKVTGPSDESRRFEHLDQVKGLVKGNTESNFIRELSVWKTILKENSLEMKQNTFLALAI